MGLRPARLSASDEKDWTAKDRRQPQVPSQCPPARTSLYRPHVKDRRRPRSGQLTLLSIFNAVHSAQPLSTVFVLLLLLLLNRCCRVALRSVNKQPLGAESFSFFYIAQLCSCIKVVSLFQLCAQQQQSQRLSSNSTSRKGNHTYRIFFFVLFCSSYETLYLFQEFYAAGTYIIRQGGRGDSFFIISSGRVQVTQRLPGIIGCVCVCVSILLTEEELRSKSCGKNIKKGKETKWIDIWWFELLFLSHREWRERLLILIRK